LTGKEDTITGSGNVYTLHALVNSPIAGDSVSVSLDADSSNVPYGYVADGTANSIVGPNLDVAPYISQHGRYRRLLHLV